VPFTASSKNDEEAKWSYERAAKEGSAGPRAATQNTERLCSHPGSESRQKRRARRRRREGREARGGEREKKRRRRRKGREEGGAEREEPTRKPYNALKTS